MFREQFLARSFLQSSFGWIQSNLWIVAMHRTKNRQQNQRVVDKCHQGTQLNCTERVLGADTGRDVQCIWVTTVKITFQANGYPV